MRAMEQNRKTLFRILATVFAFIAVIVITSVIEVPSFVVALLFLAVYLLIGYDICLEAIGGIGRGQVFDENFLMMLATIGAFATGEYPEAVAVMLLYQVGELFQRYAVGKSRGSISDLMELRPDTARVLVDGREEERVPEEVEIGEIVVVKPGERVPLDGTIICGQSAIDTSALTGESMPRNYGPGDPILSGSIATSGVLEISVEKLFYDSTVSKILDMVENASGKKAKAERFITRFAKYYTPIVVVLAVVQAVIPPLFDGEWVKWIHNAMNFLVVSCPCALVISVPMSFYCGIGAASKHGVLVKGGNYLEQLSKINTIVFDKTGTLTRGEFRVIQVTPEERKQEILQMAAIAESGSLHPIAQSIMRETADVSAAGWEIHENAGFGVTARNGQGTLYVGNQKLLQKHQIKPITVSSGGTHIYVARNGVCEGVITIADTLKDDACETIRELKMQDTHTAMLTGDHKIVAEQIAKNVGIDTFAAELLPGDKVDRVEQMLGNKEKYGVVAFVGDGINDAPVLMRADVGIAMGAIGSDAAIEAADVVLMYDQLSALPVAKRIASKTMSIVHQNIVFALGVKLLVLGMTPFGLVSIWLAIFADVGVAVLAILNAMRAGRAD